MSSVRMHGVVGSSWWRCFRFSETDRADTSRRHHSYAGAVDAEEIDVLQRAHHLQLRVERALHRLIPERKRRSEESEEQQMWWAHSIVW